MRIFGKLNNFWKKYNKVLIETTNARMERDMLTLENQQLRSTLQNYLSEMARVDSCGAPTGHRIAMCRPRTTHLSSFKTAVRTPQRPVSSISWGPSMTSRGVSPGSRLSASHASSTAAKPLQSDRLSIGSSNSDQWSIWKCPRVKIQKRHRHQLDCVLVNLKSLWGSREDSVSTILCNVTSHQFHVGWASIF